MKNIIMTLSALALCLQAQGHDTTLTTKDGTTYNGITRERVEPDGLYIEYALPGGGIGMSKVKYGRLSSALQKHFGFDSGEAQAYEAAITQANDDVARELMHRYEVERDTRRARDAENLRAYPGRMLEIMKVNQALANAYYATCTSSGVPASSLSYGANFGAGRSSTETVSGPTGVDLFPDRYVKKTH